MDRIPFAKLEAGYQEIESEVIEEVRDVLESGWYILGDKVESFEERFSEHAQAAHGVGVNSGTDALFLALRALGIGEGDEVITVSHTFVSTADAIVRNGATPVFVDVDPETYTIDPSSVKTAITEDTEAILPVHLYGHPVDMDPILELAEEFNLSVIEDASQAHGATYKDRPVGAIGDVGCFSFYPVKNLGAYGDGGMVTTDSEDVAAKITKLRELGADRKYHHDSIGINSRLDEVQAAALSVKLPYLTKWNDRRNRLANRYDDLLERVEKPVEREWAEHVYHQYVIKTDERQALREYLGDNNVDTLVHYPIPVHRQDAYRKYRDTHLPVTEKIADQIVSLPLSPWHTRDEVERVAAIINRFYE